MMITAKIEPRSMTVKELVDHLENLEMQDDAGTIQIPKKKGNSSPVPVSPQMAVTAQMKNKAVTSANCLKGLTPRLGKHTPQLSASPKATTKSYYKNMVTKGPIRTLSLMIVLIKDPKTKT